jgi:hypothetical protein
MLLRQSNQEGWEGRVCYKYVTDEKFIKTLDECLKGRGSLRVPDVYRKIILE